MAEPICAAQALHRQHLYIASVWAGIRMFTMGGIRFLVSLYLVDVNELSVASTGIILVVISLLEQTVAMIFLALLSSEPPVWLVVLEVLRQSLAAGISLAPLHAASMAQVSEEHTRVEANLYSMMCFAGTVFGTAPRRVVLRRAWSRSDPPEAFKSASGFWPELPSIGVVLGTRLKI